MFKKHSTKNVKSNSPVSQRISHKLSPLNEKPPRIKQRDVKNRRWNILSTWRRQRRNSHAAAREWNYIRLLMKSRRRNTFKRVKKEKKISLVQHGF